MSNERPVLSLKRKPEEASGNKSSQVPAGRKKIVVTKPSASKLYRDKRDAREQNATTVQCDVTPAPGTIVPSPGMHGRSPRLMSQEDAIAIIRTHWPALIDPEHHGCRLMKIGILSDMYRDVETRKLNLSRKVLRRCLKTITRTENYLQLSMPGAFRYGTDGQVAGQVTQEEHQFCQLRLHEKRTSSDIEYP